MNYAVSNNGLSLRSVDADYQAQSDEVLFDHVPTPDELTAAFPGYLAQAANESIHSQISALEATQTPRRVREGGQWMIDLNNQIAALRAQLT